MMIETIREEVKPVQPPVREIVMRLTRDEFINLRLLLNAGSLEFSDWGYDMGQLKGLRSQINMEYIN